MKTTGFSLRVHLGRVEIITISAFVRPELLLFLVTACDQNVERCVNLWGG